MGNKKYNVNHHIVRKEYRLWYLLKLVTNAIKMNLVSEKYLDMYSNFS